MISNVNVLQCIYLEACGEYTKLADYQKKVLEEDDQNDAIFKRQVQLVPIEACIRSCLSRNKIAGGQNADQTQCADASVAQA